MRIDTRTQAIDMQQIDNRRFLYNPDTGVLVLGRQYAAASLTDSSHAVELADAGITKDFDDFVRGWIGTGGNYPYGVHATLPPTWMNGVRICLTGHTYLRNVPGERRTGGHGTPGIWEPLGAAHVRYFCGYGGKRNRSPLSGSS